MARDDNSWMDISKTLFGLAQQDFENKYNERKLQAALKQQEIENQIALLKEGYIPYKDPVENLGFQPMQGGISGVLSPSGINKPYIRPEVQPVDIPGMGKYITNGVGGKEQEWLLNYQLKREGERRRQIESQARLGLIEKTNKVFDSAMNGGDSGSFPPGTTVKVGGITLPLNRKFTEGEATKISGVRSMKRDLADLKNMLSGKKVSAYGQALGSVGAASSQIPFLGGVIGGATMGLAGIGDKKGTRQDYQTILSSVMNQLLYFRTGKQINEKEFTRLSRLFPAAFRADKIDIKQIERFEKELSEIEQRIISGYTWDDARKSFVDNTGNSWSGVADKKQSVGVDLDSLFSDLEEETTE